MILEMDHFFNNYYNNSVYFRLNSIGTIYQTGTALPPCLPGWKEGSVLTPLIASASRSGETPLSTLARLTPPSGVTQKRTITFPCIFCSLAFSGYFVFFEMYLRKAPSPPGNIGI